MEVRSAGSAFEKRGARTQCGPIWRKTAHETSPDHAKESRQALEVLAAGLGRGVRKFRTTIATRKPVGPTAISSSLVLGLALCCRRLRFSPHGRSYGSCTYEAMVIALYHTLGRLPEPDEFANRFC